MNLFFQWQLVTFARKGFFAMCFCRSAPGIQGTIRNTQFSCNLRFRFVTGPGQLNRFLLELSTKTWLWFWHRDLLFKTGLSTFYHSTIPGEDHRFPEFRRWSKSCVVHRLISLTLFTFLVINSSIVPGISSAIAASQRPSLRPYHQAPSNTLYGISPANVIALLLWRYQTGNSVYSKPTVVNGVMYIGSNDGYVYALKASTGALIWRYQTGSYVTSSPTVVNGVLYIGSWDDYVYALNASTGAFIWR